MSTPVPVVDFLPHGSFCMVKRKWVRFGIIPIEKKFGQVLVGCIRVKEGSAGLPWTSIALHCKETFSGPCTEAISRKVAFSVT
jgi:hypothetical protein